MFILCDNVGWGDFSCYGGNTPTPRIDKLAAEGIRFQNYTVECQCSPSRSHQTVSRWRGLRLLELRDWLDESTVLRAGRVFTRR